MGQRDKFLQKILSGTSDVSVSFEELCGLLRSLGFKERVRGSHFIYTKEGIVEILNVQSRGGKAKPYQVKQIRNVLVKYGLGGDVNG